MKFKKNIAILFMSMGVFFMFLVNQSTSVSASEITLSGETKAEFVKIGKETDNSIIAMTHRYIIRDNYLTIYFVTSVDKNVKINISKSELSKDSLLEAEALKAFEHPLKLSKKSESELVEKAKKVHPSIDAVHSRGEKLMILFATDEGKLISVDFKEKELTRETVDEIRKETRKVDMSAVADVFISVIFIVLIFSSLAMLGVLV